MKHTFLPLLFLCSLVLCFGCGREQKPPGFPTLYPVSLTFTQEGEPCDDIDIVLIPLDNNPWPVAGQTNSNGVVTFITYSKFPGVPAGKYKIMPSKYESEIPVWAREGKKIYTLIDLNYVAANEKQFIIEVVSGKNEFAPFDLGKRVRKIVR